MSVETWIGVPWWLGATHDVCVFECEAGADRFAVRAAFEGVAHDADGGATACFRYYPEARGPRSLPDRVRLIVATEEGAAAYDLAVVSVDETRARVWVAPAPLAAPARRVRRAPRTPYRLGPCAAVVHGSNGQWRGVIELSVSDISEAGVGFKAEVGRAFLLSVGDIVRAPVTLPDGRRSWLEGSVAWLDAEGRGGLAIRHAPPWLRAQTSLA